MMTSASRIKVRYFEGLDRNFFEEFESSLGTVGEDPEIRSIPHPGALASLEWMIPTAIAVFVSKPYFEAFFQEAGKDHYLALKRALSKLTERVLRQGPTGKLVFSKGKVQSETPKYSLTYSLLAEVEGGFVVRLLIPSDSDLETLIMVQLHFLQFMQDLYAGSAKAIEAFNGIKPIGRTWFALYNGASQSIDIVDPLRDRRENAPKP